MVRKVSSSILISWGVFLCIVFAGVLSYSIKKRIAGNKQEAVVSVDGQITQASRSQTTAQADFPLPARALYPFSVIPGGVENVRELRRALARDPVAADHYAGFDLAKARVIRLNHDWPLYVSYRMGDRIFWTSKKLRIHKGERVITDGAHSARTVGQVRRHKNKIADSPHPPSPRREPEGRTRKRSIFVKLKRLNSHKTNTTKLSGELCARRYN